MGGVFLETILASLPISIISYNFTDIINAARIKAEYSLSFSDCFLAATAREKSAVIMMGDPELKNSPNR